MLAVLALSGNGAVEAATGDVLGSFASPSSGPFGLGFDGTNLWHGDDNTGLIYEITRAGSVVSSFAAPCTFTKGVTWDGTHLYTVCDSTDLVYKLTTAGATVSTFSTPAGTGRGITWDGTHFWIGDSGTDTIYRVTTTGSVVASFGAPDSDVRDMTWDGANLWIAGNSADTIYEVSTGGTVLSSFSTPAGNPRGLTYDGTSFWHSDDNTDTIYELEGPHPRITGRVFEDADFAGTAAAYDSLNDKSLQGVDVELYDAGTDAYISSRTTGSAGTYSFSGVADGTYKVRVRSATLGSGTATPQGGLNPTVPGTWPNPLPEMTWGNGAATYGGQSPTGDDTVTGNNAGPGDTWVSVSVSGADVTGVDFGFAYNLIVNTTDDANADNARSAQGSLRQFIKNANAIGTAGGTTANTSEFRIPVSDPNYNGGTGVFAISPVGLLPALADSGTTLDASTQGDNAGQTNPGSLGTGGTVGVDALSLSTVPAPEIEILNGGTLTHGLRFTGSSGVLRGLAIRGFGTGNTGEANVYVADGITGPLIERNVIGSGAASFADPGPGLRGWENVYSAGADGGTVRNNLIGFGGIRGILLAGTSTGWIIDDNELRDNSLDQQFGDGLALDPGQATVTGNLIVGSASQGVVVAGSTGSTFTNNRIQGNGIGIASGSGNAAGMTFRGTAPDHVVERNEFLANYGAGLSVNDGASGIRITRNSFSANGTIVARNGDPATGQIGIDLNVPGDDVSAGTSPFVSPNSAVDSGGNAMLDFAVLDTAEISGSSLELTGWALPGAVIEVFVTDGDPSGFGEGATWKATLTEGGSGGGGEDPVADLDGTSGPYVSPVNGLNQGTGISARFRFVLATPAGVSAGTELAATSRDGSDNTSEFGGRVVVASTLQIAGTVFEDADFAGTASAYDVVNDQALSGVDVELYDGGTDAYIASTVTAGDGSYSFGNVADGNYKVRVRSATLGSGGAAPQGGLNGTVPGTWPNPLPEMTWANGGAAYGGQSPTADDTATGDDAGPGDTYVAVTVSGSDVAGVDFGFAYNLIVHTGDDTNADNARSVQGSLRQFIKNANAIGTTGGTTANASQFRMQVAANQTAGADSWWRIVPAAALPAIADDGTTLDGTTQTANGGDANSLGPEIEIHGAAAAIDGIDLASAGNTVRGLILNGFSDAFRAAVRIAGVGRDGNTVAGSYIGTDHAGAAAVANYYGVRIASGASTNTVGGSSAADRNVISGNAEVGILVTSANSTGNVIRGNYIGTDRLGTGEVPNDNGIDITGNADGTVVGGSSPNDTNVIAGNDGEGIYVSGGDNSLIRGNIIGADRTGDVARPNRRGIWLAGDATGNVIGGTTSDLRNQISGNGFNGIVLSQAATQSNTIVGNWIGTDSTGAAALANNGHGIQIQFDSGDNTIGGTAAGEANVIAFNTADGVFADATGSDGNRISGNAIYGNGGLGIDLGPDGVGTGSGANDDKAAPTIASLVSNGSGFTITVTVDSGDTLELYRVDNGAGPTVTTDPSGSGEGFLYLGTCVDNAACTGPHLGAGPDADLAAGSIQATLLTGGVVDGNSVSGTATDGSNNTSEFAANAVANLMADLTLAKSDAPDPAAENGSLVYTLLVTNNGPDTATGVTVTDTLPGSVTLVSATPSQGSCPGTGPVTCNLGAILNGGTASVEILVTTSTAGTIANNASVSADQVDPVPGDNSDLENTDVVASAVSDVPLTQYRRIHGFLDYVVTGGSLRTQPNSVDACAVGASSSASLSGIPGTATVTHAYLYWAGSGSTVDADVTFDGSAITADRTFTGQFNLGVTAYDFFSGFEDVTATVNAKRNGSYSFADLTVATGILYCAPKAVLAGWALIVVYQDSGLDGQTLLLYDGFDIERNGSTSYLLTGIWAATPPEAKTTLVVWEGDDDLGGSSEKLEFNGVAQSDGLNPVDNVYNSTINSLPSTTSYGLDLDTFDVSAEVSAGDTLATTGLFTGPDLTILNAVVLQVKSNIISGHVYEDVNYGGGTGRDRSAATTAAPSFTVDRPAVEVELYDAAGNFLRSTTTGASGEYGFAGLIDGDYQVRAVNATVTSSRPGSDGSELGVQTYRTDASSGVAVAVTGEVGGAVPGGADAGVNAAMDDLGTFTAQSVAPVKIVTGVAVPGVDFGFNFDTIVNANDAGQGSLRQFVLNSNLLTNANLDQDDSPAGASAVTKDPGVEHSIFMVPPSALVASIDGGSGTAVLIRPATSLDPIVDAATALDGRTQTAVTGDTNGAAAEVTTGPEVIVDLQGTLAADVLTIRGDAAIVDSLGLTGASGAGRDGIDADTLTGAEFRNTTVFGNGGHGISLSAVTGSTLSGNVVRNNGLAETTADGVVLTGGSSGNTLSGNTIVDNAAFGVDVTATGINDGNTVTSNLIKGNGTSAADEDAGIKLDSSDNGTITLNTITANAGDGIVVTSGDFGNRISQNSIYDNGGLGIDLSINSDNGGDGVTANDIPDAAGGGNNRQNFPLITSAGWNGTSTVVKGSLTSTVGATFDIEIFSSTVCNGDAGGAPQPDTYGEGEVYHATVNVTDADTDGVVLFSVAVLTDLTGRQVTATATDTATGDTSEFGACFGSAPLTIVKRAFQLDGTPIASGSTLPAGMPVRFLLYIDNAGGPVTDVSLQDVLDPLFSYVGGSARYDNSAVNCAAAACSPAEEAGIFAAAEAGTVATDAVDGDPMSYAGSTLSIGDAGVANGQLDLAAGRVWAIVFTVTIQ